MVFRYFILATCFIVISCGVSKEEHKELQVERDRLQQELNDLKFSLPNLLSDARSFYQAHDYTHAKEKLNLLIQKFPDKSESIEARNILNSINEEEIWNKAINLKSVESYITNYPNGRYIDDARDKLEKLKVQNEEEEFNAAVASNNSATWKEFLNKHSNRSDVEDIKTRIIKCEIEEIMNDTETGDLPSFSSTNSDYSPTSNVEITNDTGCLLIVRYSGTDIKMIEIVSGDTKNVSLSSSIYKIAASACGTHYAGTENLHGSYSSRYYIRRF